MAHLTQRLALAWHDSVECVVCCRLPSGVLSASLSAATGSCCTVGLSAAGSPVPVSNIFLLTQSCMTASVMCASVDLIWTGRPATLGVAKQGCVAQHGLRTNGVQQRCALLLYHVGFQG